MTHLIAMVTKVSITIVLGAYRQLYVGDLDIAMQCLCCFGWQLRYSQ